MSTLAVVLACTGSAIAAHRYLITSSTQIKPGAIAASNLSNTARHSLRGQTGPPGAKGEPGTKGDPGAPGPATGAASGDLTGNYPAPTIANGVITPAKLGSVPAARVGLFVGTPQAVPSDGSNLTIVSFNTVDFDTANLYAPTAQTHLTASIAGLYAVSAGVRWDTNVNGLRTLAICVNGDTSACDFSKNVAVTEVGAVADGGTHLTQENASTLVKLSAGDTVSVAVGQDSHALLNIQGEPATFLSMLWVGHG